MYNNAEKRAIENKAQNTPYLKDVKSYGTKPNGSCKNGYYRLKDNRVIKLTDLEVNQEPELGFDIEVEAAKYPQLKDFKGFGLDSQTNQARKGFYQLKDKKIISINQLKEAMEQNVPT